MKNPLKREGNQSEKKKAADASFRPFRMILAHQREDRKRIKEIHDFLSVILLTKPLSAKVSLYFNPSTFH